VVEVWAVEGGDVLELVAENGDIYVVDFYQRFLVWSAGSPDACEVELFAPVVGLLYQRRYFAYQ